MKKVLQPWDQSSKIQDILCQVMSNLGIPDQVRHKAGCNIHVMSLKVESWRFLFHFREIFEKCIEYIGKFLIHLREILNFG